MPSKENGQRWSSKSRSIYKKMVIVYRKLQLGRKGSKKIGEGKA